MLHSMVRQILMILLLGLLLASANAIAQTTHIVTVGDNFFSPAELTIQVGDTVEWQNIQGWHNVNGTQTTFPENPESFGNGTGTNWTFSHVP